MLEVYFGNCQTSVMESFYKNSERLLTVELFSPKVIL